MEGTGGRLNKKDACERHLNLLAVDHVYTLKASLRVYIKLKIKVKYTFTTSFHLKHNYSNIPALSFNFGDDTSGFGPVTNLSSAKIEQTYG